MSGGTFCGIPIRTKSQIDIDRVALRFGHEYAFDVAADHMAWVKYAYDHFTGTLYIVDTGSIASPNPSQKEDQ